MQKFPVTKLNRTAGEVLDAAHRGPVELTHRGRRKYVLMPADQYDRLVDRHAPIHIDIDAMTEAERAMLLRGLRDVKNETS
jgi:antitoxin Phd